MLDFQPSPHQTPETEMLSDIKELFVFPNPGCTQSTDEYQRVKAQLKAVPDTLTVKYVPMSSNPEETAETFFKAIEDPENKKAAIATISGDGGHGQLVQILQNPDTPTEYSQIPLGNLGGGNGRNWFNATIARHDRRKAHNIIAKGMIRSTFPIECLYTSPGEYEKRLHAATVLGFNATARAIGNVDKHRGERLREWAPTRTVIDGLALTRGLLQAKRFEILESESIDSDVDEYVDLAKQRRLYELMFINAPRIAKIVFAPGVKLSSPVHQVEIHHKNPFEIGFVWTSLLATKLSPRLSSGHDLLEPYSFTVQDQPLAIQVDGETMIGDIPLIFEAGTQVKIQGSSRPLRVIATKKRM